MENEKVRAKRILAVMPEEEPVFLEAASRQYAAKLVNISFGGALISVMDCCLQEEAGQLWNLHFSSAGRMFAVTAELVRACGRYAAFRFVNLTNENTADIGAKLDRMETLSTALSPALV